MHIYRKTRLFTTASLKKGALLDLEQEQSHYLLNVMRRKVGDKICIFNSIDGEWLAQIAECGKKTCQLLLVEQILSQKTSPDIWLCFAPVKNAPIANIVQKATELGASLLQPVITKHTIVNKINDKRLSAIAIEAAEQCERLDVPQIMEIITLEKLLASWDDARQLIVCDESGAGKPMVEALKELKSNGKYAVLIGPEGGFSQSEFALLRKQPYVTAISMGPRILRADTAAIVALAGVFSILGDWDEKPSFRN
jgi:16S rRNA (uracil1498-N3)-methyltransferase